MESSLSNFLMETILRFQSLTEAKIFLLVESSGPDPKRRYCGSPELRSRYEAGDLFCQSSDSVLELDVTAQTLTVGKRQEDISDDIQHISTVIAPPDVVHRSTGTSPPPSEAAEPDEDEERGNRAQSTDVGPPLPKRMKIKIEPIHLTASQTPNTSLRQRESFAHASQSSADGAQSSMFVSESQLFAMDNEFAPSRECENDPSYSYAESDRNSAGNSAGYNFKPLSQIRVNSRNEQNHSVENTSQSRPALTSSESAMMIQIADTRTLVEVDDDDVNFHDDQFVCEKCGVVFKHETNLKHHEANCDGEMEDRKRKCELCHKLFNKSNIARHRRVCPAAQGVEPEIKRSPPQDRAFRSKRINCPDCGVEIAATNRSRHMKRCAAASASQHQANVSADTSLGLGMLELGFTP